VQVDALRRATSDANPTIQAAAPWLDFILNLATTPVLSAQQQAFDTAHVAFTNIKPGGQTADNLARYNAVAKNYDAAKVAALLARGDGLGHLDPAWSKGRSYVVNSRRESLPSPSVPGIFLRH
jgi:hypothetical protein